MHPPRPKAHAKPRLRFQRPPRAPPVPKHAARYVGRRQAHAPSERQRGGEAVPPWATAGKAPPATAALPSIRTARWLVPARGTHRVANRLRAAIRRRLPRRCIAPSGLTTVTPRQGFKLVGLARHKTTSTRRTSRHRAELSPSTRLHNSSVERCAGACCFTSRSWSMRNLSKRSSMRLVVRSTSWRRCAWPQPSRATVEARARGDWRPRRSRCSEPSSQICLWKDRGSASGAGRSAVLHFGPI